MLDACLMVHGSWLKAHGSWLMAKGGRSGPGAPTGPSLGENESTNFPGSTFEISRFPIIKIVLFAKYFRKNILVRYRGIKNKRCPGETRDKMEGFEGHFYYIEMSVYRIMLKSGLSDHMYHQIGWNFASSTVCSVRSSWKPLTPWIPFEVVKKQVFVKNQKTQVH